MHLVWRKKLSGRKYYNYTVDGEKLDPVKVFTYSLFFMDEEMEELPLGSVLGSEDILYHVNQFRKDLNIRMYELEFDLKLQMKINNAVEKKIESYALSGI